MVNMIYLLLSLLSILITIAFVVGTHECAHFFAARLLGVKVLRFSIGFGKVLHRWRDQKNTEYVLSLIPLGGYVKMLDETEELVAPSEQHLAFNRQPFYKKGLIVIIGPLSNTPLIGEIKPHSIAAQAGLKAHEEIVQIDHKVTTTWTHVIFHLLTHAGNQDHLTIKTMNKPRRTTQTYHLPLKNWHLNELSPDPLGDLGIVPYTPVIPLVIGHIQPASPAAQAGLKIGDELIALNHKKINHWEELLIFIRHHPGTTHQLTIKRQTHLYDIPIMLQYHRNLFLQKQGYLGISPHLTWPTEWLRQVQYGPLAAIPHAWQQVADLTYFNVLLFGKLITGKLSLQSLGGPITIFESAGAALNDSIISFLSFLAFLSISIGIINLLPIPGLDGGHLFFQVIEWVIRRPVPEKIQSFCLCLGFLLLFFILTQAIINDILRLL
jgi:regulator of sigma E protease